jgi:hypothetical protein
MSNDKHATCPIKGCNMTYSRGILGWHKHVERVDAHPYWNPMVQDSEERKAMYVAEFPEWFKNAVGHQTPAALRLASPPPPPRHTPGAMPAVRIPVAGVPLEGIPEDTHAHPSGEVATVEIRDVLLRILELLATLDKKLGAAA